MKKLFMVLLGVGFFATAVFAANDVPVQVKQLPDAAQHFVKKYFSDVQVAGAMMDGGMVKSYEVMFVNGGKVDFDAKGEWTEIETPQSVVPADLVPKEIADYAAANHPGLKIVKLERCKMYWEVGLDNDMELKFNKQFKLVGMDD